MGPARLRPTLRREHVSLGMRLAYTALAFLISVLLARLLGPAGLGQYYEVIAWMLLIGSVIQSGWTPFLVREIAARVEIGRSGEIVGTASLALRIVGGLAVVAAIALVALGYVAYPQSFNLFLIAAPVVLLLSISLVWQAVLRGLGWTLLSQLCENLVRPGVQLIGLLCFWIALFQVGLTPARAMVVLLAATAASAVVAFVLERRAMAPIRAGTPGDRPEARHWLRSLGQNALIAWCMAANPQIATVILGTMASDAEIADFRIALQLSLLLPVGLIAIVSTYSNEFSRCVARNDMAGLQRLARRAANFSLIIALPIGVPFVLFGEPLIRVIFGPAYVGASVPLIILIIGQVANSLFGAVTAIAIAARSEAGALGAHAVSTIGNLLLCLLLVPRFGAAGAAAASAISLIVWNLLIFLHLRRQVGISSFIGRSRTPSQKS